MSEDNGTYILALVDGYKVSQLHAAENLLNNKEAAISAYKEKLTWDTPEKALNYALMLEMENQTEYGILYIEKYKKLTWEELQAWPSQNLQSLPKVTVPGALGQSKSLPCVIMNLQCNK